VKTAKSRALFKASQLAMPGGVNSPVRAFRSVGGDPLFIKKAKGVVLEDVDGNSFLDYVLSWGPMILGHAHPSVLKALITAAKQGTSYGAPCQGEMELAKLIVQSVPSIEQVRLVNSGTEAVMSAIRLARAYTKRDCILKFDGCYHGHADHLLVKAGSGVATLGLPDTPGVPKGFARHTLTAPYNDIQATEKLIHKYAKDLAAIIVEPVAGNMGVVPPIDEFLPWLRMITKKYESF
jgi:glutamate-1-semialdehyde 2,1-aminomutase